MLNKIQKLSAKRTKSAPSTSQRSSLLFLSGVCAAAIVAIFFWLTKPEGCTQIGNGCFALERVDRGQTRERGLSGRESLASDRGMMFVFDDLGEQCMWMKDMRFALDIIWLDETGIVQKIEQNIHPTSFPQSFCSSGETKYVVELNAGSVEKISLKQGDKVVVN